MSYKHFAAGAAVALSGKLIYDHRDTIRDIKSLYDTFSGLEDTSDTDDREDSEFAEDPPDEMIERTEMKTPEDLFGDIMEGFDTDTPDGSSIQLGNPDDNPFEEEKEFSIGDLLGEDYQDMMDQLEEEAYRKMREEILESLEDGPKDWNRLKEDCFGETKMLMESLGGPFKDKMDENMNRQLDDVLQALREEGAIRQREDNFYELTE